MLQRPSPACLSLERLAGRHIHFIGIGGIGMSSIASILLARGFNVSGSDIRPNRLTQDISRRGGRIFFGHSPLNLREETGLVVYSTSIGENNPEIIKARQRNIPIVHRSDIVAQLVNPKSGVAVTGAHGKTTTTALSALLLIKAGLDPTVVVGGEADFLGGNWRNGEGDYAVCEADESDGTFRKLKPRYAILTNIDHEHMEHYKDFEDLIMANKAFIENVKDGGRLITSYDDINIKRILKNYQRKFLRYSLSNKKADIHSEDIKADRSHTSFEAVFRGRDLGLFELNIPGRHNVENSLAVILLGIELGIDVDIIKDAVSDYKGTLRRFEIKADIDGIIIIEDYAHHPREIMATISSCRNWPGRRLIGVFQPHRYTRTRFLKKDFGKSFLELDELILTDIYSASEKPIEGVTTKIIYDEVVKNGQKNAHLLKKEEILPRLLKILKSGDIVLVLGAGDIGELSDELVKWLKTKRQGSIQRAAVQTHDL